MPSFRNWSIIDVPNGRGPGGMTTSSAAVDPALAYSGNTAPSKYLYLRIEKIKQVFITCLSRYVPYSVWHVQQTLLLTA
jgi:hypothetical protein